ncbi:hypothetical protein [Duganella callida]|uniref:Uncharacterized protein n=1 Tax=Duganella callida TaxID=2561932 RepID=A0A4Y9S9H6_9BURK|nr:hypothetical protein [Duganella callida]TFW16737.1 hypothetical protein E4L98_22550 [Duganella callida]
MENEPGLSILSLFDQLIEMIKQRSPTRSDGKPLDTRVYSQLVLGMPVVKADYGGAWSPIGGTSLQATFPNGKPGTLDPAPVPGAPAPAASLPPGVTTEMKLSMQAAYKVAALSRMMLKVTKDDAYSEYPTGRHLDFAYNNMLTSMRPDAETLVDAEGKARLDAAQKLLYQLDAEGRKLGNTPLYDAYLKNARALGLANAAFNTAFNAARRDPILFESWPQDSGVYIDAVKQAQNDLNLGGAVEVEAALDAVAAIGRPYQASAIHQAIDEFSAWDLGLAGVPTKIPYSYIVPANWCNPDDDEGVERIKVNRSSYSSYSGTTSTSASQSAWQRHASSASGGGGFSLGFMAFGGSHSTTSTSAGWQDSTASTFHNIFGNTATNLSIDLEFMLCTIQRPWLTSDLFAMQGWRAVGIKANGISDGTIDGQVDSQDKLIPMIPQQFLVVRNVPSAPRPGGPTAIS